MRLTSRSTRCVVSSVRSLLLAAVFAASAPVAIAQEETLDAAGVVAPAPPSIVYDGLFQAVALADIVDAKDWVDVVPLFSVETIMNNYRDEAPDCPAELKAFVDAHFEFPAEVTVEAPAAGLGLADHIAALWPLLTRTSGATTPGSSLIALPHPYVVPGGRFREVYYWDSYFTMLGFGEAQAPLAKSMVDNFAYLIDRFGFVPNANRAYYLSRSQPPFFFMMVGLLSPDDPAQEYAQYLGQLKREHAFWMNGQGDVETGAADKRVVRLADGAILNRYYDARDVPRDESYLVDVREAEAGERALPVIYRTLRATAESGWDFSSRWMAEGGGLASSETLNILPADLNSLLYGLERAIAMGCGASGDADCEAEYGERAERRRDAMNKYLWDEERGAFFDYDLLKAERRTPITAAVVYPLFFEVATAEQAARTADLVEERLLASGGILTTLVSSGQQWDDPNGWAPLHWLSAQGLLQYGETDLALQIAERWLRTVTRTYCNTGRLLEKYDVTEMRPGGGGEYRLQDGFGWTNGVTIALMSLSPGFSQYATAGAGDSAVCAQLTGAN